MSRSVSVGSLGIGGDNPVRVESMLKTPLSDREVCLDMLRRLSEAGCEMARVAFPSMDQGDDLKKLVELSPIPLMADIHFDPALAERALEQGCPAIRINPGNMGDPRKLERIVQMARERKVPIRIGANSGSVSPRQVKDAGGNRGVALALAVEEQFLMLLHHDFHDVILSAKSTDVGETLEANGILHERYGEYPFHVGMTESGSGIPGMTKSSVGLGLLLSKGIGDTIRVSLSDSPVLEVETGYEILRSLDLRHRGVEIISCPTCGRKKLDVVAVLSKIKPLLVDLPDGFKVAVMGCEVNGPQEARHADIGVAGSPTGIVFFRKGEIVGRCPLYKLEKEMSLLIEPYRLKS
ncbi:MAG: flavodoxin-dependent (E)-4-hydroxy-3-methylbut-2-enyl-diphosphate synthase [Synergistota bacterium]|nr:flavodoxin-dependent (E)-4-hydroxy-3-methylbut-2-enyl-diphosphate synthase [Synergistota bacterium]